jgi:hypothetical protein
MKVVFESDKSGYVGTTFEEAMAIQETAARTGVSEEALRRGMEWAAVNIAAEAGVMEIECISVGGGSAGFVVGMRCDRYEVDLTGVPLLAADETTLIDGIVRISAHEEPGAVFFRLLHQAREQQQTVQVEIPALQALFAQYPGVDG